jgi:hypothetical protein
VTGEAEVVVRPEHDHALAVDDRLGALVVVQGLVEGVEAESLRRLWQGEGAGLREDVAAGSVIVPVDLKGVDIDGFGDLLVGS